MNLDIYINETDIVKSITIRDIPIYSIYIYMCRFTENTTPRDVGVRVDYDEDSYDSDTFIIKDVNKEGKFIHSFTKVFVDDDEQLTISNIYVGIETITERYIYFSRTLDSNFLASNPLPNKLYIHRTLRSTMEILSNNTLKLYGLVPLLYKDFTSIHIFKSTEKSYELRLSRNNNTGIKYNFDIDVIDNRTCVGFTFNSYSKHIDIPLNEEISLTNFTKLYPVYDYIKTPTEENLKTTITCYKNSADAIRVFKHDYLTVSENFAEATPITFLDDCDVINPIISLVTDGKPIDFNYIYLTPLNRYYFVEDIVYKSNNVVELLLKIDILMSNAVGITRLKAFVTRNEFQHNKAIIDDKRVIHSGTEISTIEIETNLFDDDGVLAINGFYMDMRGNN